MSREGRGGDLDAAGCVLATDIDTRAPILAFA